MSISYLTNHLKEFNESSLKIKTGENYFSVVIFISDVNIISYRQDLNNGRPNIGRITGCGNRVV